MTRAERNGATVFGGASGIPVLADAAKAFFENNLH